MMIKMLLMMLLKLKWWSNWNIVECDNVDDHKVKNDAVMIMMLKMMIKLILIDETLSVSSGRT